jgi:hypothetical protein
MTLTTRYLSTGLTKHSPGASINAKDKLGDSFGTKPYLSTGQSNAAKLSQNCTGKQTDLNTVLKSS